MIYLPKEKGLCSTINQTLNTIYELYEKEISKTNPHNIYVYKDFINNNLVIKELNELGIKIIDDVKTLSSDDLLVITNIGITSNDLKYLKDNHISYFDTSCPKINKLRKSVTTHFNRGYKVIVIGDNFLHDERITSIKKINDIDKINKNNKLYIIKDLNYPKEEYDNLIEVIKKEFKEIVIENFKCENKDKLLNSNKELENKVNKTFTLGKDFYNLNEFSTYILKEDLNEKEDYGICSILNTPAKELDNYKYLLRFLIFYKARLKELIVNQDKLNKSLNEEDNEYVNTSLKDFSDLNQDGKYIRGTLIALGEYITSGHTKNYLNLATAYETFETSILIHDDIIDNAKLRRGKMTIPRRICQKYLHKRKDLTYHNDTLKLANSIGICLGDYGLFLANKIIYDNYAKYKNFNKILSTYNDIVIKTIKGEVLDVYLPFMAKYNYNVTKEEDIINIYHLKTSLYTLIGPFSLGCLLNEEELSEEFTNLLNNMGIYFQIKDDLLGIFGKSKVTGKSNTSDILEFKQTLLYSYIIKTPYKDEFLKLYGKSSLTEKEVNKIKHLLEISQAKKYTENYLENIYYNSLNMIESLHLKEDYKDLLKGLLIFLNIREK